MAKQAYVYSGTEWVPLASEVTNLSAYQTKALNQYPNRNLIINGAMQVAQRGTSVTGITSGQYTTADRWLFNISSFGTWTSTVENDAPTGSGFRKSFKMLCTTADASPTGTDYAAILQKIEGQNLQAIKKGTAAAEQLTLSFWVKSNVTGNHSVMIYDQDNTRFTSFTYAISASATWEKKTITIPADTTGAFDNDNNDSLQVYFNLGSGSSYTGGAAQTTWASFSGSETKWMPSQTNVAAATNNYFQITGVQLEVGDTATPFEFKKYADDLLECLRYLQVWKDDNKAIYSGHYWSATESLGTLNFKIPMRAAPTVTASSGSALRSFDGVGQVQRVSTSVNSDASSEMAIDLVANTAASTAGRATFNRINGAGAYIWIVSEL